MAIPIPIQSYLRRNEAPYDVIVHAPAYTAQEETAASHIRGREWAKTVVCFAGHEPILVVVPAPYAVDLEKLRAITGEPNLRLAREDEFAGLYPDCEPGAMPPFGPLYGQRVVVDASLTENPTVAFHAGTHTDAVRMQYSDFERLVHPAVGHIAREAA
jgi:Ala-tRNA(Pro) deacylase